ncbi:MAG: hypothetical protein K2L45_08880 [Muribaculaceae bacterium]|nr:hypothetical protein [Muribaculaceae bacterium]
MKTLNDNSSSGNPLPTDLGDRAVKGVAWLGAIIGVFALAILICAAFHLSPTPSPAKPQPVKTAMQKTFISSPGSASNSSAANVSNSFSQPQFSTRPVILKSITVIGLEPSNPANATAKIAAAPAKLAAKASVAKPQANPAASMSKADMDRIEKEALEVIHGDYGNNPGRAQKLGPDYAAVQARVNQLLHS